MSRFNPHPWRVLHSSTTNLNLCSRTLNQQIYAHNLKCESIHNAMSSIRFALTVHDRTSTQRKSLDSLTTRYLKSWLGMPICGATSASIYSSVGLNIQSMSHLYFQCHSLSIARTLERADIRTTQALNTKLRREDHFVRKDLGNTRAHQFYQEAITLGTNSMTTLKTKIKSAINVDQSKACMARPSQKACRTRRSTKSWGPFKCYVTLFFWKLDPHPPPRNANNIEHYTFVTLFSRKSDTPPPHPHLRYVTLEWPLAHSEESDITWRSAIYSLPRCVLSFVINSSMHPSYFS